MPPKKPVQSHNSGPKWLVDDLELVLQWAELPGRTGPKTPASIRHYKKNLDGLMNSVGKPLSQMTVANITRYVDGGSSINALSKVLRFFEWAYAYGHITGDLVYAYEKRNPHIVKTDKVWETQDEAVFEAWVATCRLTTLKSRVTYRKSIMEMWSYCHRPLATLTPADVKVMDVPLNDRGIGVRFAKWLARQPIAVAVPDVPVPDSPETRARMQADIEVLNNTAARLITAHDVVVANVKDIPAIEAAIRWDISMLSARIHALETLRESAPPRRWAELEERLARSERAQITDANDVKRCLGTMDLLVQACYTGNNPIHPLDAKDHLVINRIMTRSRHRTRLVREPRTRLVSGRSDTIGSADHPSFVPMHPSRNGVAPALVDSDPRTDKWPE